MVLRALVIPMLAAAVQPASPPITVTGHAWAPFISPMGEPFRARSQSDDTLANWFRQADGNRDGVLTADEMRADAARFFATLDSDRNGEIGPDEVTRYEWDIAPDIQVMARTRRAAGEPPPPNMADEDGDARRKREQREAEASLGLRGELQGAARYALLNIPEPVAAADADFNRAITLKEFEEAAAARFALLDSMHAGRISLAQLQALRSALSGKRRRPRNAGDDADTRVGTPLPKLR